MNTPIQSLPVITKLVLGLGLMGRAYGMSPVRYLLQEDRLREALTYCHQSEVLPTSIREVSARDVELACVWVYLRMGETVAAEKGLAHLKGMAALPEYQILQSIDLIHHKRLSEAKAILSRLAQEHRSEPIGLTAQEAYGEFFEAKGELDTAAFIYKQVVGVDPKRGWSQWGLSRYYLSRQDSRRALEHLELTSRLWPTHMASRFNLAMLYMDQGDNVHAAKWLIECYRLNRADPGVLEQLGVVLEKRGRVDEAVRYWERAVAISSKSQIAKSKLNQYLSVAVDRLMSEGRLAEALVRLNALGSRVQQQPPLLLRRGLLLRAIGIFDKAAKDLVAYLKLSPRDARALREAGICYLNLKLKARALDYFKKASAQEPDNGIDYAWIAFVLESMGKLRSAATQWKQAVEHLRDPDTLRKATRRLAFVEGKLKNGEEEH